MSNLLINFKYPPTHNFWEFNSQFRTVVEFEKIKEVYNDAKASDIMWAIAFLCEPDPSKNLWASMPENEKKRRLKSDYLKDDKFKWTNKIIKRAVEVYKELILTQAERSLAAWQQKMKERDDFIADHEYAEDNYKMLDKMMSETHKLYAQLYSIRDTLKTESEKDKKGRGDKILSLTDAGEI